MKGKTLTAILILVAASAFGLGVLAESGSAPKGPKAVPLQIPYHGILEKDGVLVNAIGADTVSFRVSLWDDPAAGNQVWPAGPGTYDEHAVNVYDGRFAFEIGSDATYVHVPDTPLYLDIQVMGPGDADFAQLGGRQRFLSAPYAVAASRSDTDFLVNGQLQVGSSATTPTLDVSGDASVGGALTIGSTVIHRLELTERMLASVTLLYNESAWAKQEYRDLAPAANSVCFLVRQSQSLTAITFDDSATFTCDVYVDGAQWKLMTAASRGHHLETSIGLTCEAACLTWGP